MTKFNYAQFAADFSAVLQQRNLSHARAEKLIPIKYLGTLLKFPQTITAIKQQKLATWAGLDLANYERAENAPEPNIPAPKPVAYTPDETCECVHYDALTCIAKQNNTTRFNASILFSKGAECNGQCTCPCHRKQGKPVTEQEWKPVQKRRKAA